MLTCRELAERLTDHDEGSLAAPRRAWLWLHLARCAGCRAFRDQLRTTRRALAALPREAPAPDVRAALVARFRAAHPVTAAAPRARLAAALAALERLLGRGRGWAIAAALVVTAATLTLATGGADGPPFDHWRACLAGELGAALLPVVGAGLAFARAGRSAAGALAPRPPSAGALAALAAVGGFAAYLVVGVVCDQTSVLPHTLAVHVGGVVVGTLLGAAAARLPVFTPARA